MIKPKKAFTLTELMIVVVIISIIAAFAVPNYAKAVERSHRRDAEMQLTSIYTANFQYRAVNSIFWPPTAGNRDVTAINDPVNGLGLGVIPNGMTYFCSNSNTSEGADDSDPNTFTCWAHRGPATNATDDFRVEVNQGLITPGVNPVCVNGTMTCP